MNDHMNSDERDLIQEGLWLMRGYGIIDHETYLSLSGFVSSAYYEKTGWSVD